MGGNDGLRLEHWLKHLLRDKTVPGLEWVNEYEETFKIPWANQKSNDWKPGQEDSKVLLEWARHKYNYKVGQKEELSKWKTNLRCAINKCPNIERLKTFDTKFLMMCKFVSQSNNINDSPASLISQTSSGYNSCLENSDEMTTDMGQDFLQETPPASTASFLPTILNELPDFGSLVPDDEDMESGSLSFTSESVDSLTCVSEEPPQNLKFDSAVPNGNITLAFSQSSPSDIQSAESAAPLVQTEEKASPIFMLEVLYDVPHRPVMSLSFGPTTPRCKIFSGHLFRKLFLKEVIPPDKEEFEVELCSVENLPDLQEKNKKKIAEILGTFERGLGLWYDEIGDIWAERRSAIRIFYSDEQTFSIPLPRKKGSGLNSNEYCKIFEYNQFLKALEMHFQDRSHPCPKDYVLLTLGHECELNSPSPLRKVLVHIKVHHIKASKDLIYVSGGEGASSNPNSMYSLPDSLDKVISGLDGMNIVPEIAPTSGAS